MTGKNGGARVGAGRPVGSVNKNTQELKKIARAYTDMALQALVEVARQVEIPNARVSAAKVLLDRGWGKPIQATETRPANPAMTPS